jgi:hypothetical protein
MSADRNNIRGVQWTTDPNELFSDKDCAFFVLRDLDYEAQLLAVHNLLGLHLEADQATSHEIEKIGQTALTLVGDCREDAIDHWVDSMHGSAYEAAARNMAAVGMLAPLVESICDHAFRGMQEGFFSDGRVPSNHDRWAQTPNRQWDCHFIWHQGKWQRDVRRGIIQLAEATGLWQRLPGDLGPMLQALFEYRNKMFHCGLEWPVTERDRFEERIKEAGWPASWFQRATNDKKPWMFYLSETFIQHCLAIIDQVVAAIGSLVRDELLPRREGA